MKRSLLRRGTALVLALLLLCPAVLADGAAPPLTPEQKQEDLEVLYDTLRKAHPDLFHSVPEADFLVQKAQLQARLDALDDKAFALELQGLAALARDSHTTLSLSGDLMASFRLFPFSAQWFDGAWYLSAAEPVNARYVGWTLTAMNGLSMDEVVEKFSRFVSADNPIKLRRQTWQTLNVAEVLAFIGVTESGGPLTLTLQKNGENAQLTLTAFPYAQMREVETVSLQDLRTGAPATAFARKNYFSLPLNEETYYIQYNVCQEDPELPMADFAGHVTADLDAGSYRQVLLDLRNNGGGSDGAAYPLLSALAPRVRKGELRLWGLIGETTFSSAIINAVEIRELGGLLAGAPTSGSVDHFGSVGSFALPNSGLRVGCSRKWIDQATLFEAAIPYGVESLQPDFLLEPTLADYLEGEDTVVNALLTQGLTFTPSPVPEAVLTRGRLLSLLYAHAGAPAIQEGPVFDDLFPVAYYADAAAWAAAQGIVTGTGLGTLEGARPVTRAEAAVLISRYAAWAGLTLPRLSTPWADEALIPAWALDAAHLDLGLAGSGGHFDPDGGLTLAQGQALLELLK